MRALERLKKELSKRYTPSFAKYVVNTLEKENMHFYLEKKVKGKDILKETEKVLYLKWDNLYKDFWKRHVDI